MGQGVYWCQLFGQMCFEVEEYEDWYDGFCQVQVLIVDVVQVFCVDDCFCCDEEVGGDCDGCCFDVVEVWYDEGIEQEVIGCCECCQIGDVVNFVVNVNCRIDVVGDFVECVGEYDQWYDGVCFGVGIFGQYFEFDLVCQDQVEVYEVYGCDEV